MRNARLRLRRRCKHQNEEEKKEEVDSDYARTRRGSRPRYTPAATRPKTTCVKATSDSAPSKTGTKTETTPMFNKYSARPMRPPIRIARHLVRRITVAETI